MIAEWVEATTAGARGATGSGRRSRRSIRTRNKGEVTVSSAEVGAAVKARQHAARLVTAAALEMRHQGEKGATLARAYH